MKIENAIKKLNTDCEIYYKKSCVSNEQVVTEYINFLAKTINPSEKRVSFSLNTGSIIFDIVSVVVAVVSSLGYNENTNDDILASLIPGDMVLYKNKRFIWDGIKEENGNKYFALKQNDGGSIMALYDKNKHNVKEYHGNSKITDGRGIRKRKTNREDFFAYIYDVVQTDIPSAIDASFVVVANKDFSDFLKEIVIKYKDKTVNLLELVAASYYTSGGEDLIIGSNPSKKEPVIKMTSQISVARSLALSKSGNTIAGVIITASANVPNDNSELKDLADRKKIKFFHYMTRYDVEFGESVVREFTNASVFACTKLNFEGYSFSECKKDTISYDLNKQINNIINLEVSECFVEAGISTDEMKKIKDVLFYVKNSNVEEQYKDQFVLNIYALINLFMTAPFNISTMEKCLRDNKLRSGVNSPKRRLEILRELSVLFSNHSKEIDDIVEMLNDEYLRLLNNNDKAEMIDSIIRNNIKKRIAIIVPKAYYQEVMYNSSIFGARASNIFYETPNRFNPDHFYDVIIVVGYLKSNKFKVFECHSASKIYMVLNEYETAQFSLKKSKASIYEKNIYEKHKKYTYRIDEKSERDEINASRDFADLESDMDELDSYIEHMKMFMPERIASYSGADSSSPTSEISYIGLFDSGERIFLSKYYSSVVYDGVSGVVEKNSDSLQAGDILVFTKNDNYTKNIVDTIFEELLAKQRLNESVNEAYFKSTRWKDLLREYKDRGEYSFREITEQLNDLGLDYGEVAIRSWIIPESHIVGPRHDKAIHIIGILVGDDDLTENFNEYSMSFKIIRNQRRMILKLIERAIKDKLAGKKVSGDATLQIVFDNIDKLSVTCELESIQKLEEPIYLPVGLVNRPVDSEDIGI